MDSYHRIGFMGFLRESIELLPKTGQLLPKILVLFILLRTLLSFTFNFFTEDAGHDLLAKSNLISHPTPTTDFTTLSTEINKDTRSILLVLMATLPPSLAVSFFSMTATMLASALAYCGRRSSFGDLLLRLGRSCLGLLVTSFYITILGLALSLLFFIVLVVASVGSVLMGVYDAFTLSAIAVAVCILAGVVFLWALVVWVLGMVVSAVEKGCYGMAALRKAWRLIKGRWLHGLALNFVCGVVMVVFSQGFGVITSGGSSWVMIVVSLIQTSFSCAVTMFQCVGYTVLYFQCMKEHNEEIELIKGGVDYEIVPTSPFLAQDAP